MNTSLVCIAEQKKRARLGLKLMAAAISGAVAIAAMSMAHADTVKTVTYKTTNAGHGKRVAAHDLGSFGFGSGKGGKKKGGGSGRKGGHSRHYAP